MWQAPHPPGKRAYRLPLFCCDLFRLRCTPFCAFLLSSTVLLTFLAMRSTTVFWVFLLVAGAGMVAAVPLKPSTGQIVRQESSAPFYTYKDMLGGYTRGRVTGADNLCPKTLLYTSVSPPDNTQTFSYRRKLVLNFAICKRTLTCISPD